MAGGVVRAPSGEAALALNQPIRAAGGIIRRRNGGRAEVVLVHRPKYDDWSLPKGKLLRGEEAEDAASREVREETGLSAWLGEELDPIEYLVDDRPKVVRYWLMEPDGSHDLRPTGEVDRARWVSIPEAIELASHEHDRELLRGVAGRDAPVLLVRHAKAGNREEWDGDDALRPLSKAGRRQAKSLATSLDGLPIERILTSPAIRCVETVEPLAARRARPIERREELAEGAPLKGLLSLIDRIDDQAAVLCAHGDLIPAAVGAAEAEGAVFGSERGWKKASTWILERDAGLVVRGTYRPPPDADARPSERDRRWRRRTIGG